MRLADDPRDWRRLLLALTGVTVCVYLALAFLQPMTLAFDDQVIQDDARQFLSWMPRLSDPSLLRGDLIADYWHSVSPPLYRALFAAAAWVGLPPPLTARLLPALLLPATAWFAWPVALRIAGRPAMAFVAAVTLMALVVHEDSIYSSTPRATALLFLLLVFDGLLGKRPLRLLLGLALLALTYPAPAVVCLGMIGLSRVRTAPRLAIDLSPRSLALVGAAVAIVAGASLSFGNDVARWRPIVTLAQAQSVPGMALPNARSSIVDDEGRIGWFCSPRMGFLPELASCSAHEVGLGSALDLLAFLPLLLFAWRGLRARDPDDPHRLFRDALVSALVFWALAGLVAFKLHLPSRYSQRVLGPLELLALGTLVGRGLAALPPGRRRALLFGALAVVAVGSFATPVPKLVRPKDRDGLTRIALLPKDARIAGVAGDLPLVPALTGRAVLATTEHAIPYELGYYLPFHARLLAGIAAVQARDPQAIASFIRQYRVTALAVAPSVLASGALPHAYRAAAPDAPATPAWRPALASAPPECRLYSGRALVLFDGACLVRWAGPTAS